MTKDIKRRVGYADEIVNDAKETILSLAGNNEMSKDVKENKEDLRGSSQRLIPKADEEEDSPLCQLRELCESAVTHSLIRFVNYPAANPRFVRFTE